MTSCDNIKVWDPLIRISHWSMVGTFATAYLSVHDSLATHVMAGYILVFLVLFRLVWGFFGTEHAHFRNFVASFSLVFLFLKDMSRLQVRRFLGHNPAGAAMVITLLVALAATTLSGMKLYAVEENSGPFAIAAEPVAGQPVVVIREESDGGYLLSDRMWEDVHILLVDFSLVLIGVHIGGVLFISILLRENLPWAMISGKKPRRL